MKIVKLGLPDQTKEKPQSTEPKTVSLKEFKKKQVINWVLKNSKPF